MAAAPSLLAPPPPWRLLPELLPLDDALLWLAMALHASACPHTKVEESFHVQATHDSLFTSDRNKVSTAEH